MSVAITGTIQRTTLGMGAWILVTPQGETYELHRPPADLRQEGLTVTIHGQIQGDRVTTTMVGPVLTVETFTPVDSRT